jgi:mannose-6-phosphate isomerase-like protein (cupin superfamily)
MMKAFELATLFQQQQLYVSKGQMYLEFLRESTMSMGLYVLPAGAVDGQEPHTEDEVYYVAAGRGRFVSAGEDVPVQAGSILFVPAHEEHRFHSIEEDLHILVVFAPAEYSLKK